MNSLGMSPMRSGGGRTGDVIPKGYKTGQMQQFTPEQMGLLQQGIGMVGPESYLSRLAGGDQSLFAEMEAPALQQFQGALGGLASRFSQGSGARSMGSRLSSGFQNTATSAVSNFAQQLAANRQNLQRQALGDIMQYSHMLMGQRPYERFLTEKQQKQGSGWGPIVGGVAGGVAAPFIGLDPMTGAQAGAAFGSLF